MISYVRYVCLHRQFYEFYSSWLSVLFYHLRERKLEKMLNHHWARARAFFQILVGSVECIHFFLMIDLMLLVQFVNAAAFINITIPIKREREREEI